MPGGIFVLLMRQMRREVVGGARRADDYPVLDSWPKQARSRSSPVSASATSPVDQSDVRGNRLLEDTLMHTRKFPRNFVVAAVALVLAATLTLSAAAQTESVVYTFTDASDGAAPYGTLVADGKGNFFGV